MKTDSIQKRYTATLLVNIFKIFAGIINSTIVPATLGVAAYGNYNFLLKTFKSIQTFLTLSTGSAFFTLSSKKVKSGNAFLVFFAWAIIQFVVIILIALGSVVFDFKEWLFPGQTGILIFLLGGLQWVNYISSSLIQFGETKAESVKVQKINFISNVSLLVLTVTFFGLGILNLNTFILINYTGSLIIILMIIYSLIIKKKNVYFEPYSKRKVKYTISYFIRYCRPLVVYGIFGFFFNIFDRWILQVTAGSVEQGHFSLAFRFVSLSMIFTTSVINIFWREISNSFANKEIGKIKSLFMTSFSSLFFLSSVVGFLMFHMSESVIQLFFDESYYGAIPVLKIMAFYPILYTITQLNTTFFYATEKVKLHRNISILTMTTGVIIAYLLVAPSEFLIPGLNLGSIGVASKLIINPIVLACIQLFFILKYIKIDRLKLLTNQMTTLLTLGIISFVAFIPISSLDNLYLRIGIFCVLYGILVLAILNFYPQLAGISKEESKSKKALIMNKLKSLIGKK